MGKGKNKVDAVVAPLPKGASSSSWLPSRKKRKQITKWLLWLVVPLLLAAAVAYAAPPPPEPIDRRRATASSGGAEGDDHSPSDGGKPPPIDTHSNASECAAWAGSGQCKANPAFMLVSCAFSCAKLEYAKERYNKRCPPTGYPAALPPGQMHATFDRIMREFPELEPERISEDPPVILFHKFFSESETEAFIRHGKVIAQRVACTQQPQRTRARTATHASLSAHARPALLTHLADAQQRTHSSARSPR